MAGWGKVPVRSADTPGFIVNRVNRPFTLEALAILAAGRATIETIDAAVRAGGFPLGPFELMDLTGIDISLAAAFSIFERSRADGDPLAERFQPSPIQERLVAAARLGRKTGAGFYSYDEAGRQRSARLPSSRAVGARPTTARTPSSSNGSRSPSSTRRIGQPATASPRRPTSTSRCGSAPRTRSARSSGVRLEGGPEGHPRSAHASCAAEGARFHPASTLIDAAATA